MTKSLFHSTAPKPVPHAVRILRLLEERGPMGAVEIRRELGITNGVVQGTLGRMLRQGRVARRENPGFDRWTKFQLKPKPECRWLWYATGIEWKPSKLWTRVRMNAHAYPEAG